MLAIQFAVICLILNILIPGLGTLLVATKQEGRPRRIGIIIGIL